MTRYKALIQVKVNGRYDKADKHFVQYQLNAFMEKMMRLGNLVEDYDVSVDDMNLRQGVYEYT